ncbi:uncharacterized protein N7483_002871 [Penicillium malachiteum]|uniref:uncharacterized protein n=1 Tax=Penicillium malachiteum TaxID=1324776 RepID=UPI0025495A98|nr:uncharacterized protein N7483_002871 [Penicillium malachiteum]KAJ5737746.1 hypothetical protein N7483_002871 [Penicillium malachiteum]
MAATTYADFNATTEGLDVAKTFSDKVHGNTILITGVNIAGIGFSTAQAFASQSPAHLIITGRSLSKIEESVHSLRIQFPGLDCRGLQIDLSSQQSVRQAANRLMGWTDIPSIDIVINNAGIMCIEERTLSCDGIELHFATNHIGHWLFTCLIMPKLIKSAKAHSEGTTRIVNVTSASPTVSGMRWSDMNFDVKNKDLPKEEQPVGAWFEAWGYTDLDNQSYNPLDGYNRSKVANVLSGIGLNQRLFEKYGIFSLSVHPGVIGTTELGRNFPSDLIEAVQAMAGKGLFDFKTAGAGAATSVVAALDPALAKGVGDSKNGCINWGSYLVDCQISDQASPLAVSSDQAEKLWELSEKLVGQSFSW